MSGYSVGSWVHGLAEWIEGEAVDLSVALSWKVDEAFSRASWYRAAGYHVSADGSGPLTPKAQRRLGGVAELGGPLPDALARHNPMTT